MKVKCTDNHLSRKYLTVGKVYNVELNEKRGYTIVDDTGNLFVYPIYRFEIEGNTPVLTNFKSIKAIDSVFNNRKKVISKNDKYIVIEETKSYYFVVNDKGQLAKYPKSYFIELNKGE